MTQRDAHRQHGLHLDLAGRIATLTLLRPLGAGALPSDVMGLVENVIVDVMLRLGGSDETLDIMIAAARRRIAEIRMTAEETKGST